MTVLSGGVEEPTWAVHTLSSRGVEEGSILGASSTLTINEEGGVYGTGDVIGSSSLDLAHSQIFSNRVAGIGGQVLTNSIIIVQDGSLRTVSTLSTCLVEIGEALVLASHTLFSIEVRSFNGTVIIIGINRGVGRNHVSIGVWIGSIESSAIGITHRVETILTRSTASSTCVENGVWLSAVDAGVAVKEGS